jgi:hypothetical protein
MGYATTSRRVCADCGDEFEGEHFMRVCKPCYAKQRRAEADQLRAQIVRLEKEVDYWQRVAMRRARIASMPDDFAEMLPRLLQLAHPDKHANSETANRATQWLLQQRARLNA